MLANGAFDPFHAGHLRYLAGARAHGDMLIVAINDDASVRALKGAGRPVVAQNDRAAVVAAMAVVDAVLIFADTTVDRLLEELRPHVHAKGTDYTVEDVPERETSARLGIETVITGDPKDHSSSSLIERFRGPGPGAKE